VGLGFWVRKPSPCGWVEFIYVKVAFDKLKILKVKKSYIPQIISKSFEKI
jgi:hypothetical protein